MVVIYCVRLCIESRSAVVYMFVYVHAYMFVYVYAHMCTCV